MPKSPTLHSIDNNFINLKRKLGFISFNNYNKIIIVFLYSLITLLLLILYKPMIICDEDVGDFRRKISYTKFILYYIILQFPVIVYVLLFNK